MAVEDSEEFGQQPKLDRYDDALLVVFYGAQDGAPVEVHLHVASHVLVTVRRTGLTAVEALHDHTVAGPPRLEDAIVYRVLDALTDTLTSAIDAHGLELDRLESEVLRRPRREQLERIYRLRRLTAELHRRITAEHELFTPLTAALVELPALRGAEAYLHDVGDHLGQAEGELLRQAAALNALTDLYFNANTDRVARVSERLTLVATLLLPLTVITGFFGMNFGWLVDNISSRTDFLVFGVTSLLIPFVLAGGYLLRRRGDF